MKIVAKQLPWWSLEQKSAWHPVPLWYCFFLLMFVWNHANFEKVAKAIQLPCNFYPENSFRFTNCPNTFYSKTVHSRRKYCFWLHFFSVPSINMNFVVLTWLPQYRKQFWRLQSGLIFLSEISSISLSGVSSCLDFEICIFVNNILNKLMCCSYCIPSGGI